MKAEKFLRVHATRQLHGAHPHDLTLYGGYCPPKKHPGSYLMTLAPISSLSLHSGHRQRHTGYSNAEGHVEY